MRSLPSTAALLLAASHAHADDKPPPIQGGTQWVGAFFDISWRQDVTTHVDGAKQGSKETTIGGDISYGYFVTKRWGLSLDAGGLYAKRTTYLQDASGANVAPATIDKNLFIAPTVRYYVNVHEDTYFFLQGRASVHGGTLEDQQLLPASDTIQTIDYDQVQVTLRFAPGITVFLSNRLAAEALIGAAGFTVTRASDGDGNRRKRDDVLASIFASSLNVGLTYYFEP